VAAYIMRIVNSASRGGVCDDFHCISSDVFVLPLFIKTYFSHGRNELSAAGRIGGVYGSNDERICQRVITVLTAAADLLAAPHRVRVVEVFWLPPSCVWHAENAGRENRRSSKRGRKHAVHGGNMGVKMRKETAASIKSQWFWATVWKTVRPMLSDRCLSCPVLSVCLSVCNVGVLWPNGLTDQVKLGMQVGFGPGHIFGPYLCGQMAA